MVDQLQQHVDESRAGSGTLKPVASTLSELTMMGKYSRMEHIRAFFPFCQAVGPHVAFISSRGSATLYGQTGQQGVVQLKPELVGQSHRGVCQHSD